MSMAILSCRAADLCRVGKPVLAVKKPEKIQVKRDLGKAPPLAKGEADAAFVFWTQTACLAYVLSKITLSSDLAEECRFWTGEAIAKMSAKGNRCWEKVLVRREC